MSREIALLQDYLGRNISRVLGIDVTVLKMVEPFLDDPILRTYKTAAQVVISIKGRNRLLWLRVEVSGKTFMERDRNRLKHLIYEEFLKGLTKEVSRFMASISLKKHWHKVKEALEDIHPRRRLDRLEKVLDEIGISPFQTGYHKFDQKDWDLSFSDMLADLNQEEIDLAPE